LENSQDRLNVFRSYFSLSRWESLAIISLLAIGVSLVAASIFLPKFYETKNSIKENDERLLALVEQIKLNEADTLYAKKTYSNKFAKSDGTNIKGYVFDPNTLDSAGWIKLGLTPKQTGTILNYSRKGGQFRNKDDVKKMYSISDAEYMQLEQFIQIKELPKKNFGQWEQKKWKTANKPKLDIELNSADTALLNKLNGIGPALAFRIVTFREKIGGFTSKEQIKEVYGITDSTYQKIRSEIRVNLSKVRRVDINTVTFQELKEHPYFMEIKALAILKFRKNNQGRIDNWDQIKSLPEIDANSAEKIKPYIKF
jgi:competence protein ComEA